MDMEAQPPAIGDGDVQGKLQIPEVPTCDSTKACWPLHMLAALQGCGRRLDTAQHVLHLPLAERREASSKSWGRQQSYSGQHCGDSMCPAEPKPPREHQPLRSHRGRGDRTLLWHGHPMSHTLVDPSSK